ncbi:MAG: RNA polymerase sigma factor region1.1 domain-containing protein, partial [Chthoniobacteraceae bacterium]
MPQTKKRESKKPVKRAVEKARTTRKVILQARPKEKARKTIPAKVAKAAKTKKPEAKTKAEPIVAEVSAIDRPEMQVKLRELILLAKDQGHLTFDDLSEAMPDTDPAEIEAIMD